MSHPSRPIVAIFYDLGHDPVRQNCGSAVSRMYARTVQHIVEGRYPAAVSAEVLDSRTGRLHAVIRKSPTQIRVIFNFEE